LRLTHLDVLVSSCIAPFHFIMKEILIDISARLQRYYVPS
jgi:hypothetical protein